MSEQLLSGYSKNLVSATTVAASGVLGSAFALPQADSYAFILDVGTVTGTSPTFDVELEMSPDGGTTYYAWARFAQVTASSTVRRLIMQPMQGRGEAGSEAATATHGTGALSANAPMVANFAGGTASVFQFYVTVGGTSPSAATIKIWVVAQPRATAV
jgi:hypothetical protein